MGRIRYRFQDHEWKDAKPWTCVEYESWCNKCSTRPFLLHDFSKIESLMQLVSSLICLTGFGTEAAAEGYEVFKEAMAEIGVLLCRHIHHPTNRDLAFPEAVFWMEACGTHLQGLDATLRFWACPFRAVWPRLRRSWRSKTFVGDLGDRHWQRGGWACEMALFTRHLMQGHRQCRSSIHTAIITYEPYREHQGPYIELLPSTKDNDVPRYDVLLQSVTQMLCQRTSVWLHASSSKPSRCCRHCGWRIHDAPRGEVLVLLQWHGDSLQRFLDYD